MRDECRFVRLATMWHRREKWTIGFDEQAIVRYARRDIANVVRVSERHDAGNRHVPAEIERTARKIPRLGEAMQYADGASMQAQDFERIGFRGARVDDHRERRVARDVEMRRKTVALVPAHVIGIDLEVVEPGFTDANDPLMPRRFAYPIERDTRARAFRMQSGAGPYVCMTLGQLDHGALGIGIHADAQKLSNADGARSREAGVSVVEIVQMAVRIDQHTYMVCVWRSD